jgi:MSHA biogenesis protein MshM
MPYLAHFGLTDHPFTLTPNIDYYYPTQENANLIASLDFALRRDSGIIKIVGEVGTGKTLLCRLLMKRLEDSEAVAYINAPQADAQSILHTICEEFGVELPADGASPYTALNRFLVEEHAKGRLAVVVVDEAQHLGKAGLEAIRLASNLETEKRKLLQIVLFGQTELDDLLRDPDLRQLNQRLVFTFATKSLTAAETRRYVNHRLAVSRRDGVDYPIFSDAALSAIAQASRGIPRVVNILADKSLLVAFSDGSPTVQRKHAREAIRDTSGLVSGGTAAGWLRRWRLVAAAGAVGIVVLVAGAFGWHAWRGSAVAAAPVEVTASSSTVDSTPAATPAPLLPSQPQTPAVLVGDVAAPASALAPEPPKPTPSPPSAGEGHTGHHSAHRHVKRRAHAHSRHSESAGVPPATPTGETPALPPATAP